MDLENLLVKRGSGLLGVGSYSAVVSDPTDAETVIKFGHSPTDPWPAWAKWCRANPSPWAPVIRSFRWITNRKGHRLFYVAELEKLEPWTCGRYATLRGLLSSRTLRRDLAALAEAVGEAEPDLAFWLYSVRRSFPVGTFDLGSHNWLLRGDQLVLTDPLRQSSLAESTKEIAL